MLKKIALIPSYEPTKELTNLILELKENKFEIIIVNDGSSEKYDSIFENCSKYVKVLKHDINKGKGAALKTGLDYIIKKYIKDYVVVTMDCDGQHKVEDAIKICNYASSNPNTLVLGKRLRSNKTPLRSRLGNSITRFFYRLVTKIDVYDTQTGLRAFTDKLVSFMLDVEGDRFEYEMNVLLRCASSKIKIKEIEIQTIYINKNSGSHFNTIKDSILVYKQIFKFVVSSLVSFIIDYLLYSIAVLVTNKVVLSNIFARIISASINFNINKKIVFNSNNKASGQIIKYILLAIVILILNSIILNLFVYYLSFDKFIAKIIVEILLFVLSWFVQKNIIFNKGEDNEE